MDVISVFISMVKPRTFSYNDYTKMIFVESNHLITNTIRNGSSQTSVSYRILNKSYISFFVLMPHI